MVQAARKKPACFAHPPRKAHVRKTGSEEPETIEFERQPAMTTRIELRFIGHDLVMLYISGPITEQEVATLRHLLEQAKAIAAIDLNDVLIVDRDAIPLLAECESNGVELRNCPAYVREWITRVRTDRSTPEERTKDKEGNVDT